MGEIPLELYFTKLHRVGEQNFPFSFFSLLYKYRKSSNKLVYEEKKSFFIKMKMFTCILR